MKLVPISASDEELAVHLECDPEMMKHICGPRPEGEVRQSHKRRLEMMKSGEAYMYKIVDEGSTPVLGMIGFWKADWEGFRSWEIGWFVLSQYQRRGIATKAARDLILIARNTAGVQHLHAYPAVSNIASNAIAQKIGMESLGEFDNQGFSGILRCIHWRLSFSEP